MQSVRFIVPRMLYLDRKADWPLRRWHCNIDCQ